MAAGHEALDGSSGTIGSGAMATAGGTLRRLFDAAKQGNLEKVQRAVEERGYDVNVKEAKGARAALLHAASRCPDPRVTAWLLSKGADPDIRNAAGCTPLQTLLLRPTPSLAVVKALVAAGASVHLENHKKLSAWLIAAQKGHIEVLEELLGKRRRQQPHDDTGEEEETPAVTDVDIRSPSYGLTALHAAAGEGELQAVRFLLDSGAAVDALDSRRQSPLFSAMKFERREVVSLLLERGADPLLLNKAGFSALHLAAGKSRAAPLVRAFFCPATASLWQKMGTQADLRTGGCPLFSAVKYGQAESVRVLVDHCASCLAERDKWGATALMRAVEQQQAEVVRELLKRKASADSQDKAGDTALHYAARDTKASKAKPLFVSMLLNAGASSQVRNGKGELPLDLARTPRLKELLSPTSGGALGKRKRSGGPPDEEESECETDTALAVDLDTASASGASIIDSDEEPQLSRGVVTGEVEKRPSPFDAPVPPKKKRKRADSDDEEDDDESTAEAEEVALPPDSSPIGYVNTGAPASLLASSTATLAGHTQELEFRDIILLEKIGKGAFGEVRKGTWFGSTVAVKFFSDHTAEAAEMFAKEVGLISSLKHPNIVSCYGACTSHGMDKNCMVMEFVPSSLTGLLRQGPLDVLQVLSIAKGIACGMCYLHKQNIIHRDLKPSNILIDAHLTPKIADFGVSRASDGTQTMTGIGTPLYMAPEMLATKKYGEKVDVYAFALIVVQMFTRTKLFAELLKHEPPLRIAFRVVTNQLRPEIPPQCPPALAGLVRNCWSQDPTLRPSFAAIVAELTEMIEAVEEERRQPVEKCFSFNATMVVTCSLEQTGSTTEATTAVPSDFEGGEPQDALAGDNSEIEQKDEEEGDAMMHDSQR